jgi:hypothetical protein
MILILGCGDNALVEVGLNDDESLFRGTLGDLAMRVIDLELSDGGATYSSLWSGPKTIFVPIQDDQFVSVTDNYIETPPQSIQSIRITVDSLRYIQDNQSVMLSDTSLQFIANSFGEIGIFENQEIRLVINIMSNNWFDAESLKIRAGHLPFEGARLNTYNQ